MKQRRPQCIPDGLCRAFKKQSERDQQRHYGNCAKIEADDRILEHLERTGCGEMEYHPEMHPGYDHEENDDAFNDARIEICNRGVLCAETACSDCTERVIDRIKETHP